MRSYMRNKPSHDSIKNTKIVNESLQSTVSKNPNQSSFKNKGAQKARYKVLTAVLRI